MKIIATALITSAIVGGGVANAAPAHEAKDIPTWVTRPCQSEDSSNCRWIATGPRAQGDGTGHTFIKRTLPDGTVCQFFAQRKYAATHDNCK